LVLVGAGIARLLSLAVSERLVLASGITLLAVGLRFSGWLFEQLATRRPRLRRLPQAGEAAS
jgi:hypothetical protein